MSAKELRELQRLNAVVRSIDRVSGFNSEADRLQIGTVRDLEDLRLFVRRRANAIINTDKMGGDHAPVS